MDFNLKRIEGKIIEDCLEYYENNKTAAAEALGISLKSLYDRLGYHGLKKKYERKPGRKKERIKKNEEVIDGFNIASDTSDDLPRGSI